MTSNLGLCRLSQSFFRQKHSFCAFIYFVGYWDRRGILLPNHNVLFWDDCCFGDARAHDLQWLIIESVLFLTTPGPVPQHRDGNPAIVWVGFGRAIEDVTNNRSDCLLLVYPAKISLNSKLNVKWAASFLALAYFGGFKQKYAVNGKS